MKRMWIGAFLGLAALLMSTPIASAQSRFPDRPIYIIVGHAAGGSTDLVARAIAPFLNQELKVPVVVKNMPGAAADIANNYVWNSKPDGYTLNMIVLPAYVTRELLKKQNFEMLKMSYIYGVAGGDYDAIAVAENSPIKNFADLKKLAAKRSLTVGSVTRGSNSWLSYAMMRGEAGINLRHVPYTSGTNSVLAAVGGHVDLAIASIISLAQPVKNKEARIIAAFGAKHDPRYPNVSMMVDLGYKHLYNLTHQGLVGPPGMPQNIVDVIAKAAAKAEKDPKFQEVARREGISLDPMSGPEFHALAFRLHEQVEKILIKTGEVHK